ncbi:unannotated protein [freshwater metagenome]|uniref:Unannotated protein n=1 Tax=freshwater metagenome TaxID=449393 RepID=A0A6J6G4N6_9ZZZZ
MNIELCVSTSRVAVGSHDDTFAGSQTVRLNDIWWAELVEGSVNFLEGRCTHRSAGGDSRRLHDLFSKILRTFEPSS